MIICKNGIAFCHHENEKIIIYGSLEDEFYFSEVKKSIIIDDFDLIIDQYLTLHDVKHLIMKADILNDNVILFRLYVNSYYRTDKVCIYDETNYVPYKISIKNMYKLLNKIKFDN